MTNQDTTDTCADLVRRRNNLETGIRQDRREIARLNARIRSLEIQLADLRALNTEPDITLPDVERDRDGRNPRFNPVGWLRDQVQEFSDWLSERERREREIRSLLSRLRRIRYERDRIQSLMTDSIAGNAKLLQNMRRLGCPAAGTTDF